MWEKRSTAAASTLCWKKSRASAKAGYFCTGLQESQRCYAPLAILEVNFDQFQKSVLTFETASLGKPPPLSRNPAPLQPCFLAAGVIFLPDSPGTGRLLQENGCAHKQPLLSNNIFCRKHDGLNLRLFQDICVYAATNLLLQHCFVFRAQFLMRL